MESAKKQKSKTKVANSRPQYVVADGIRSVVPYVHEFRTFAKGRWLQRPILEVLSEEFGAHDRQYWENAISIGNVQINGRNVSQNYLFKNSDALLHRAHRHEPPIVGQITLVGESADLMAVCKPPSMPMHPCGAYRHNTLISILQAEPLMATQSRELRVVHRLDRVTSGLVILAKSNDAAKRVSAEIRSKQTTKIYLARVKGRFPCRLDHLNLMSVDQVLDLADVDDEDNNDEDEGKIEDREATIETTKRNRNQPNEITDTAPSAPASKRSKVDHSEDGSAGASESADAKGGVPHSSSKVNEVLSAEDVGQSEKVGYHFDAESRVLYLRCPVGVVSYKNGVHACCPTGKQSISKFVSIGYDEVSDTSLIECRPITGRTHQLRLHLQFLGNPIANDPCYGGELFYQEEEKRRHAISLLRIMRRAGQTPMSKVPQSLIDQVERVEAEEAAGGAAQTVAAAAPEDCIVEKSDALLPPASSASSEFTNQVVDSVVLACRYCRDQNSPELERILHCDGIWLHAWRYTGSDWSFQSSPPTWALVFNLTSECSPQLI